MSSSGHNADGRWHVYLDGDNEALRHLSSAMGANDPAVLDDDGRFRLESAAYAGVLEASEVLARATTILASLSAFARLRLGSDASLKVSSIEFVKPDGRRDHFMFPEGIESQTRFGLPTISVTRQDGSVEHHRPGDRAAVWAHVAATHPEVQKALRLRDANPADWPSLARLCEVIEDGAGGEAGIVSRGWCRWGEIDRLMGTANNPALSGDGSRHGVQRGDRPAKSMTLDEAKAFLDRLLTNWIDWVDAGPP